MRRQHKSQENKLVNKNSATDLVKGSNKVTNPATGGGKRWLRVLEV